MVSDVWIFYGPLLFIAWRLMSGHLSRKLYFTQSCGKLFSKTCWLLWGEITSGKHWKFRSARVQTEYWLKTSKLPKDLFEIIVIYNIVIPAVLGIS